MKLTKLTALAFLATSVSVYAADMQAADANGDGMLTADEFTAAYPEVDPATFVVVDVNADGMIDAAEFATATGEGGVLAG